MMKKREKTGKADVAVKTNKAEILQALSAKLIAEFGRGFSRRNFASTVRFAEVLPDERIVSALLRQRERSHLNVRTLVTQ